MRDDRGMVVSVLVMVAWCVLRGKKSKRSEVEVAPGLLLVRVSEGKGKEF